MNAKQHLIARVRSHADELPAQVALEHGDRSFTYRELSDRIDERTAELMDHGARGAIVAVERAKSAEFIVDYLSVLATGGTVVPLDPDTPGDRRATFLELARPALLVQDSEVAHIQDGPTHRVPEDGAFVYFTSGSTGIPKPVLGSAAALRSFLDWFCPEFAIRDTDRFAFLTGLSFEASLRDIFPPLAAGATLVIPDGNGAESPETTVDWLARQRISVLTVVPSVARSWLLHGRACCDHVRAAFFLGEPLAADVLKGWQRLFPTAQVLVNSYGSTESGQATIYKCVGSIEESMARIPAGRPVPGTQYCFIEPEQSLTADLVFGALERPKPTGEIVITSRACSHGYLGMPEENAERFVTLGNGVTAYRTGDLGRVDENGDLVVVGRADDEVKINGVRVHPAEVLRAIRGQPGVCDAFVTATRADDLQTEGARLTAYVVPVAGAKLNAADLRLNLMESLPLAMIPSSIVEVPDLPRARTGKIDRAALVELAERFTDEAEYVAPSDDVEYWLAEQFGKLLGVERVSAAANLFALGGDSIAATRLSARISTEFGVTLSQRTIFAAATVTELATAIIDQQLMAADPDELEALLDSLDGPPDTALSKQEPV